MVVQMHTNDYDVRIDRATPWGNPFVLGRDGDRDEVITKFYWWAFTSPDPKASWIRQNVSALHGKVLGCWCAPQACHGDVLAAMAVLHYYDTRAVDIGLNDPKGVPDD